MQKVFKLGVFYLFIFLICGFISPVFSQEFRSDYQVEYFIFKNEDSLPTKVKFNIKITNLRSDVYVKKFTINFPKNFIIHDIVASDNKGAISPQVGRDDESTKIELEFTDPQIGRDTINNFYLEFFQDNLFKVNGNVWEVILPTVENKKEGDYKIIVNLPEGTDKKISIAKPKPDWISGSQISWTNPSSRTIYAVFGDKQLYQVDLTYHLKNPKFTPAYIDIAFPPDTLYQKIYLKNISPQPDFVYLDDDTNYLGRYILAPTETKNVVFSGVIEVNNLPRENLIAEVPVQIDKQKKYLLSKNKYWNIDDDKKIKNLNSAEAVYNFVVGALQYDYKRVAAKDLRLGAKQALAQPNHVVCVEFTDLFIAIAREKGILAREMQGYGFSQDPQLRPLSLTSDVLHSWPEFYDEKKKVWLPVDPTWQNTSGIDYFSSLDLNHIAFVIHGKRSDFPLSAGMYKTEESKDILIKAIDNLPEEKMRISSTSLTLPSKINDNQAYKIKFNIINEGNVYIWNLPVKVEAKNINFDPQSLSIDTLAPLQKKELVFDYKASQKNKKTVGEINVYVASELYFTKKINIMPFYYDLSLKISLAVLAIFILIFLPKLIKKIIYARKSTKNTSSS